MSNASCPAAASGSRPRRDALGEAIKRKAFARGFKREVRLPPDFVDRTERLLERAALDALAMAGKAGLVVAGFAKAEAALAHEEVVALLHAAEAAPTGSASLTRPGAAGGPTSRL